MKRALGLPASVTTITTVASVASLTTPVVPLLSILTTRSLFGRSRSGTGRLRSSRIVVSVTTFTSVFYVSARMKGRRGGNEELSVDESWLWSRRIVRRIRSRTVNIGFGFDVVEKRRKGGNAVTGVAITPLAYCRSASNRTSSQYHSVFSHVYRLPGSSIVYRLQNGVSTALIGGLLGSASQPSLLPKTKRSRNGVCCC
jgi:hypothetical protein